MCIIHWFRRDLRLLDNTALWHACRDSTRGIVPLFIFDDDILKHPDTGAPIVAFMLDCLRHLRDDLRARGGDLILAHGRPAAELERIAQATGASRVYYNKDYAPDALKRDRHVEKMLEKAGIQVRGFKDQVLFEEREILSASRSEPLTVYTPYRNAWNKRLAQTGPLGPAPLSRPNLSFAAGLAQAGSLELPTAQSLGFDAKVNIDIPAGESGGQGLLRAFCSGALRTYPQTRNLPAIEDGTSRLSPHLRHGTLSPRQCAHAALQAGTNDPAFAAGAQAWLGELAWRDFFQQILFNFPEVATRPFKRPWRRYSFPANADGLRRWQEGTTGFPIVDAGMRQLARTGWMHNRVRMITAMFLTKDLLIDYRRGERWFMRSLIDGETAQNNGNWQWVAGCGTDAQPYFRIFNPARQSRTCDPGGKYIRRWCPELAPVPDEFIHEPHLMDRSLQEQVGCRIGVDYPAPMLDHAEARKRALDFFKSR
jgi:deoxyribodipyrimidine photo-lyase